MWKILFLSFASTILLTNGQSGSSAPNCEEKEKSLAALDLAKDSLSKAKKLYPDCDDGNDTECGRKDKSLGYIDVAINLISDAKENYPICPPIGTTVGPVDTTEGPVGTNVVHISSTVDPQPKTGKPALEPRDCSDVLENGHNISGIYTISPEKGRRSLDVFCDMDTDGGGWTVIQRRGNFGNPKDYFYKDWQNYKVGFGNVTEDFWIGNDNIYALSNPANTTIRFDLEEVSGNTGFAQYQTFWIENETTNYTLHISGYNGNVGDAMNYHNDMQFSTKDRDNDKNKLGSCAKDYSGAWWYNDCYDSNLNGIYQAGIADGVGVNWQKWTKTVSLAAVEIKLRSF